ncbi:MAG: orotate phosphoribosyltransferase [Spirochaetes bacterium]|nr:orotate phosphoribosyltransferase [Spirochaetota bacterium]
MKNENELIYTLFELYLFYYGEPEYLLDNETKAPFFFDINAVNSFPFYKSLFMDSLVSLVKKIEVPFSEEFMLDKMVLAAVGHSGIPFATLIADKFSLPMLYIRDVSKKHGKKNIIEGSAKQGASALLFTDTLSSKAKIENAARALEEASINIIGVITILDLLNVSKIKIDDPAKTGKSRKVPVYSLINLAGIIKRAKKSYLADKKVIKKMINWSKGKNEAPADDNIAEPKAGEKTLVLEALQKIRESNAKEAAQILLDIKAVALSVKEPFRYASGILSPIYCDNRLLISHPDKWNTIIDIMAEIIETEVGLENVEVIAGTSTAGIPHAALLAELFSLPMVYVKSEKGEIGKKSNIEGALFYGKKVLVIEDLVSTGKSSIESVKLLREQGAIVDNCVAIFTYQMESAIKIFADEKCNLFTASNFKTLIKTAVDKKYIKREEAEKAEDWNNSPAEWGKKHGYE